jgi:hypothetical protein
MGGGDKGCTINLIGCGASGAYALGPDDEEEERVWYLVYQTYTVSYLRTPLSPISVNICIPMLYVCAFKAIVLQI